jgi:glycine oxidase
VTVGHALWPDQLSASERAALDPGIPTDLHRAPDILVVGGGSLGVAIASACATARLGSIVLLERDTLASGASGGAAGQLLPEAHVGVDPPQLVDLGRTSLAAWRQLEATIPGGVGLIDLDWLGLGPAANRFSGDLPPNTVRLNIDEVCALIPGLRHPSAGVLVRGQARLNPLRAMARLVTALPRTTAQVATHAEVRAVSTHSARITAVHTTGGSLTPGVVVFATGTPPRLDGLELDLPASEVKGHIVVTEPTSARLPGAVDPLATSLDDGRLLIGGSLDVGDDTRIVRAEILEALWSEVVAAWPAAMGARISYGWACFRPAHPDFLPIIDRVPGLTNAWLTSGHYRTGILMAPGTADALARWIQWGAAPDEVRLFGADRLVAASS